MNDSKQTDVVLVVDDSPEILSMLNDTLDQEGITVLVALEGSQALNIAKSITPDIILLDAMMPNMDGFETCRQLKQNKSLAHIPVIFMTGLSDTDSVVKGLEAGGVDYVNKPINGQELLARMRVHLNNARQTSSAHSALDSAGQYILSVEKSGELIWATPQALQLFKQSGFAQESLDSLLKERLGQLLSPQHNVEQGLLIEGGESPLEVRYISQSGDNEYLLQLSDANHPSETDVLRKAFDGLTEREAEVLLWVARGKTNREIAMILGMSPRTVNKHLEQVFKKVNVENRTTAAIVALKYL